MSSALEKENLRPKVETNYKSKIKWKNVLPIAALHLCLPYAIYAGLTRALWKTILFNQLWGIISGIGITGGAHRFWCHRSYKAKLPLQILLAIFHSMAAQTDIFSWCRDHRVHHKFTETDADPHNIERGFFFAHVGWLMRNKHPAVTAKGQTVYMGDLAADPLVQLQKKFHIPLSFFFCFYLPTMIPVWLWDESLHSAACATLFRYVCVLNATWSVNSFAHLIGDRPFDRRVAASEHPAVALFSFGEGWHNYHHVFPWDYSASELGYTLNLTKMFIDAMAWMGLAYDLKRVSAKEILSRKLRTGDGTRI